MSHGSPSTLAPARLLPLLWVTGARVGMSGVLVGLVQIEGKKIEGAGARGAARVSMLTGVLGRPARVRAGATGGRRRGTSPWRVADAEEHRQASWEGPRWPEVVGRGRLQCGSAL